MDDTINIIKHQEKEPGTLLKKLLYIAVGICYFFSLWPLIIFGIVNTGSVFLFILGTGLLLLMGFWRRIPGIFRRILAVSGTVCALAAAVLSWSMFYHAWLTPPPEEGVDAVIVLGAKVNGSQPSLMLQQRLGAAQCYLAEYPDAVCIVTGGQGADETMPEAEVMANYLIANGIAENRILIENRSSNTLENLQFAAAFLDPASDPSVVIVTHDFHQMRAGLYAENAGFQEHYSLSVLPPSGLILSYWIREWPALCKAWILDL